jgi:16S rRNA processing protein RimM
VTVALLSRVRGVRGELVAVALSGHPERFETLERVFLFGSGPAREVGVEAVRTISGSLVFKFRGIDSIEEAEPWRGAEVRIPSAERLPLEAGEFFQSDLVGCEVFERATGELLGMVTGWDEGGAAGLLQVGRDLLIPFARSICVVIDTARKRIEVDLPEGLKDLNRSGSKK